MHGDLPGRERPAGEWGGGRARLPQRLAWISEASTPKLLPSAAAAAASSSCRAWGCGRTAAFGNSGAE